MGAGRTMYGRQVIYTDAKEIDKENVVEVLEKALQTHRRNRSEIQYLYDYYKGKQPILNRVKEVRPEINNKIVENNANHIVSFKVGYLMGEPVQYMTFAVYFDIGMQFEMDTQAEAKEFADAFSAEFMQAFKKIWIYTDSADYQTHESEVLTNAE